MVNGNYILYGDRPPSESTYIEDHVIEKTDNRKNKRKSNRTANDLQRTLNLAQLDNETDSVKYEKKKKEPQLLRYVPNTEIEEHIVNEKFERPEMKPIEEKPKRYSFSKRPKNPTDGSVNYAYSRSSSGCSSPNGSAVLPTISEHGDQFPSYSGEQVNAVGSPVPFDTRFEKYFAKPIDLKQPPCKGSNPDSLYRVPVPANGGNKHARVLRSIRWVVAAVTICAALTAFIFYLMPLQDDVTLKNKKINETLWNSELRHSYNDGRNVNKISSHKQHHSNGTKTTEIDFYDAPVVENTDQPVSQVPKVEVKLIEKERKKVEKVEQKLPVPPVFPSHVTAEVQYGNEKVDDEPRRTSKYLLSNDDYEETTLKPHITQKPEKPLAIYFKDGEVLTSIENVATEKTETSIQEHVESNNTADIPNRDLGNNIGDPAAPSVKFTSGHSKFFGIGIEDIDKLKLTTQSSLYKTKVSPTLPAWRSLDDTTTANYPVNSFPDSQPQCRSTSLQMCRGVLPYDLAGPPVSSGRIEIEELMPQMEYMLTSNCSERLRHFLCALLEPECGPKQKLPCYNLCKVVTDSCDGLIPQQLHPLFHCKRYPSRDCAPVRAPCYDRELPCGDNTCVPRDWMCDGTKDCPAGEDEAPCSECAKNEFKCASGGCIQSRWVCDGYSDCAAGEDETGEVCGGRRDLQGGEAQGSAPAPLVEPRSGGADRRNHNVENDSSKEILMTSDTSNGLRRNYTRRPTASRLTPYHRPGLKALKINSDNTVEKQNIRPDTEEDLNAGDINFFEEDAKIKQTTEKAAKDKPVVTTTIASTKLDQNGNFERTFNGAELLRMAQEKAEKEASPVDDTPDYDSFMKKPSGPYNSHQAPCASSDLRCVDGRCITLSQLCDGTIDCSDHADEDNCYT